MALGTSGSPDRVGLTWYLASIGSGVQEGERMMMAKTINPESVFTGAMQFENASTILAQVVNAGYDDYYAFPQVVLSAHALELLLKCLHFLDKGNLPRRGRAGRGGHDLQSLFYAIDPAKRSTIAGYYAEEVQLARIPERDPTYGTPVDNSLATALEEASEAFDRHRYVADGTYASSEGQVRAPAACNCCGLRSAVTCSTFGRAGHDTAARSGRCRGVARLWREDSNGGVDRCLCR